MTTKEIFDGVEYEVTWHETREVIDRIDCYDKVVIAEGEDKFGNEWKALASISCGEMVEIEDPELVVKKSIWKVPPKECTGDCKILDGCLMAECKTCGWDDWGSSPEYSY
jgi:hypothetical protein